MVKMRVLSIGHVEATKENVLLLQEEEGERVLPLVIGLCEAMSIALGVEGGMPRPATHDLLAETIRRLGGRLLQVVIHDVRENTFIAQLEIETSQGIMEIDCRPSDGVALAVRAQVPVLVTEEVLEGSAVFPDED
ncbi:MAG: bifunctional nuclease family protein [Bacillota bacterium]|nr:bifunctional nuclease family protein [Bacillota bacterium]